MAVSHDMSRVINAVNGAVPATTCQTFTLMAYEEGVPFQEHVLRLRHGTARLNKRRAIFAQALN